MGFADILCEEYLDWFDGIPLVQQKGAVILPDMGNTQEVVGDFRDCDHAVTHCRIRRYQKSMFCQDFGSLITILAASVTSDLYMLRQTKLNLVE